ncbi:MAG: tetratricopeptide repeat protein [Planctomycetota bacterium]
MVRVRDAPASGSFGRSKASWIGLAALLVAVLGAYSPTLSAGFLNLDDDRLVTENPLVASGVTAEGLRRIFTDAHQCNWIPLTWLSHMIDCELFGLRPAGHHATSVLLHALNVLLLCILARRMLDSSWGGLAVAALFGLHPIHVESVAWVAERKGVLSTTFLLATLLAWFRYVREPSAAKYALTAALLALGLMAKQMLVTLPFVLLLLDVWPLRRVGRPRSSLARLVVEKLPFFALAAGAGVVTVLTQSAGGAVQDFGDFPAWARPANAAISVVTYLGKVVLPHALPIFVPHPRGGVSVPLAVGALVLIALVTVLTVRARQRRPYLLVGWLWYLGTLVPIVGLLQIGEQALAYRYTYVPMIGVYLALVAWMSDLAQERRIDAAILRTSAVVLAITFAGLTFRHLRTWKDNEHAYLYALEVTQGNYLAHNNLASHYVRLGSFEKGLEHAGAALRIEPGYVDAYVNVAAAAGPLGRFDETVEACREVLTERPTDPRALYNLGAASLALGRREEALQTFERLVEFHPRHLFGLQMAGRLHLEYGTLDRARAHFERACAVHPESAPARLGLGLVLERQGELEAALASFEGALELSPDFAEARAGRARVSAALEAVKR